MASKWIGAFLAGTAVGAAVAQLAMQNHGKENRQDIAPAVSKGAESDKQKTQDFAARADRLADEVKEQVEQIENVVDMGTLLAILFLHYATRAYLADKLARTAVSRLR
jgi:gas vesicle protein